jgi:hypothetical protein
MGSLLLDLNLSDWALVGDSRRPVRTHYPLRETRYRPRSYTPPRPGAEALILIPAAVRANDLYSSNGASA